MTWLPGFVALNQRTATLTRALQQVMAPARPAEGIRVIDGMALQLPGGQAGVRIYHVRSRPPSSQRPP